MGATPTDLARTFAQLNLHESARQPRRGRLRAERGGEAAARRSRGRARRQRRQATVAGLFGPALGAIAVYRVRFDWLADDVLVVLDADATYVNRQGRVTAYLDGVALEYDRGRCVGRSAGEVPEMVRRALEA